MMCHRKINTHVNWVSVGVGCVSSQEAWLKCLQLLGGKWWAPLYCSCSVQRKDNSVAEISPAGFTHSSPAVTTYSQCINTVAQTWTEAHFVSEVTSKTYFIFHSHITTGGIINPGEKVLFRLQTKLHFLFFSLTPPPQLSQSFLCFPSWHLDIYSVMVFSHTQHIILIMLANWLPFLCWTQHSGLMFSQTQSLFYYEKSCCSFFFFFWASNPETRANT